MLTRACPILPSRDLDATERFYAKLGFKLGGRFEEEGYLILYRDTVELHFFRSPDHVPETCDHGVYLRLSEVADWSKELEQSIPEREGHPSIIPAEHKPWGMFELTVFDPDGTILRAGTESENG